MTIIRRLTLFVIAMFVQWWWNTHLAYWGAAPQILLALTVLVAARLGPVQGMLVGFVWGLFSDTLRADLFGANALIYTLTGYIAGILRRQIDLAAVEPLAVSVTLLSWFYALIFGLLGQIFLKSFLWIGIVSFLVSPIMNALVAIIGAQVWELWGDE